jgi:Copper type II ascorbate-dependent monooxygenase, C-terminal domain
VSARLPFFPPLLVLLAWVGVAAGTLAGAGCALRDDPWNGSNPTGPCGRGKARSCTCDEGTRGIAQCRSGGDWGECVCNPSSLELVPDASSQAAAEHDAGRRKPRSVSEDPALRDCESTFDFRAHAAGDFSAPYRVPGRGLLPGSARQRVCFYFRVPYVVDSVALSFLGLLYETPGLRSWLLYGLDSSLHADGEVGRCNGAEPGAYLLAGFAPGVEDLVLPADVGLALPHGAQAGMVLEVQYENARPEELLDRTGVRVCAARTNSRKHTAAVHFTGSQGICIPARARDFEVHGSCAPRDDVGPIHVLDVWPSMHQRGRRMQITIARADGTLELLHDAPFVFDDQQRFPPRDVVLQPGDRLDTRCYYDNEGPTRIPFGDGANEETCFGFVTAWPAGALSSNPLGALGIQPDRSCLDPGDILASCGGAADGW